MPCCAFIITGDCWAYAATAALEALVAINTGQATPAPPHLSEQELTDCFNCGSSPCDGCQGGNPKDALSQVASPLDGLNTAANYPFTSGSSGQGGTCDSSKVHIIHPLAQLTGTSRTYK